MLSGKRLSPQLIRNSCQESVQTLNLALDGAPRPDTAGAAAGQSLAPMLPLLHGRPLHGCRPGAGRV